MTTADIKQEVTKVLRSLRKYGAAGQDLIDCFVSDDFSQRADTINRQGLTRQVEYLLARGYDEEALTEQLER